MNEIVITGLGAISSIGNSVEDMFLSLKQGKHGIKPITVLDTRLSSDYLAGEIKLTNKELSEMSELTGLQSRTTLLSSIAVSELIKSSGLSQEEVKKTGFISSTTVGGMDKTELSYYDLKGGKKTAIAALHPSGEHTEKIAKLFGINAHVSTVSTACSSASNAMIIGARMIKSKQIDRVIVGGVDALSKFTMNGFKSLMILDKDHCKPFDSERKGLNLGEAAAYLLIESKESALKRKAKIFAILSGYMNVNEAFHQTASNGEGAFLAMSKAITLANLKPEDVNYINAHGTGTDNNDDSESKAINRVFKDTEKENVFFSSTKAFTGHTLAASGGVEAIISILSINNNFIPSNLNFVNKIKEANLIPVNNNISDFPIKHVLSNSFGFGGNNTSLLFSKYNVYEN